MNNVTIIIPTLNEESYLPALLDSIANLSYEGSIQVIVVDAQSEDRTVDIAKSYYDKLEISVFHGPRDIGAQRNLGAKNAKYASLLFLDADVQLPETMFTDLLRHIPDERSFIISVMHRFVGMNFVDTIYYGIGCVFLVGFLAAKMPVTNGDFMLTTQENFNKVGGFKEGAILGEDIDFGKRSIAAGATYKFLWRPMVIASLRRARTMGRTRLLATWVPAFIRIARDGPIYRGEGFDDYPFGHFK